MIILNQVPGNENQMIWVFRFNFDNQIIYAASEEITIGSQFYYGDVVEYETLATLSKFIDLSQGGTIGNLDNTYLNLKKHSSNSEISDFFNSFYPATGGQFIMSRTVEIGIYWKDKSGSPTWIREYYINHYSYSYDTINLTLIETDKLLTLNLPVYKTRSTGDHPIESYPTILEENEDKEIPIVYGFYLENPSDYRLGVGQKFNGIPVIQINRSESIFLISSHTASTRSLDVYVDFLRYVRNIDATMKIRSTFGNESFESDETKTMLDMESVFAAEKLEGDLIVPLKQKTEICSVLNVNNITDYDINTYEVVPKTTNNTVSLGTNFTGSLDICKVRNQLGSNHLYYLCEASGVGANPKSRIVGVDNSDSSLPVLVSNLSDITSYDVYGVDLKDTSGGGGPPVPGFSPFTFDNIITSLFALQNVSTVNPTRDLRMYGSWLSFKSMPINGTAKTGEIRERTGGQNKYNIVITRYPIGQKNHTKFVDNIFCRATGRLFKSWINNRNTTFTTSETVFTMPYIIESILRDEIFVERRLRVDSILNSYSFTVDKLFNNSTPNYYLGAYVLNLSTGQSANVDSSGGATLTVDTANFVSLSDHIVIGNVQGGNNINTSSFDELGGISGSRENWIARKVINNTTDAYALIDSLMKESWSMFQKVGSQYKLVDLDTNGVSGAFENYLIDSNGTPLANVDFTPIDDIYTSFMVKYNYNNIIEDYSDSVYVYPDEASSVDLDAYSSYCLDAEINNRKQEKWEFEAEWIYSFGIAKEFIKRAVLWFTQRRMIVNWRGSYKEYAQYEIGDKVVINNSDIMPDGKNNSTVFIISSKTMHPTKKNHGIEFQLVELNFTR